MIISLFFTLGLMYISVSLVMIYVERKRNLEAKLMRTGFFPGHKRIDRVSKDTDTGIKDIFTRTEEWLLGNDVRITVQGFISMIVFLVSGILLISVFFKAGVLIFALSSMISGFLVYVLIDLKGRRAVKMKEDQMESVLIDLITILHVNPNITVALKKTAENSDYPIRRDLETVVEDTQRGLLLDDALLNMLKKNRSRLIHIIITGLIAANKKGVDLIEFLKSQVDYLREKKSLSNYIRILSTGPRYTSYLIMAIPLVVLLVASLLNQDFISLLFSPTGRTVLIYSAVSYLIGFLLVNRIVNPTDHVRRGEI